MVISELQETHLMDLSELYSKYSLTRPNISHGMVDSRIKEMR